MKIVIFFITMPEKIQNEAILEAILFSQEKGLRNIAQNVDSLVIQQDQDRKEPLLAEAIKQINKLVDTLKDKQSK